MIPYAKPIAALVVILLILGAYIQGRRDEGKIVRGEYAARDLQSANETAAQIAGINERIRRKEQDWAKAFSKTSQTYQGKLKANENALAIALAGSRLFDRSANPPGGSPSSGAAATPSGRNGATGAYLPEATSRFLLGLASEADAIVLQLQSCQAVLESERK